MIVKFEVHSKSEFQLPNNKFMKKLKYHFLKFRDFLYHKDNSASNMQFKKCFPSFVYYIVLLSMKKPVLNVLHFSAECKKYFRNAKPTELDKAKQSSVVYLLGLYFIQNKYSWNEH